MKIASASSETESPNHVNCAYTWVKWNAVRVDACSVEMECMAMAFQNYQRGGDSGDEEARRDIAEGKLEFRLYGLPQPAEPVYEKLLRERLGVEHNRVACCVVTLDEVRNIQAYNEVMKKEIERRFGEGIIKRLWEEADELHRQEIARGDAIWYGGRMIGRKPL